MNDKVERLQQKILEADTIIIAAHLNPDGDAIGSSLGFAQALKAAGKKVFVLLEEYGGSYRNIPGKELIFDGDPLLLAGDLFISLDCGDALRLGEAAQLLHRMPSINIDHHISNVFFGDLNYVLTESSSTAEVVYSLICDILPLNDQSAEALYTGILSDTGGFRHTNTSPATMYTVASLLKFSFDFSRIYNDIFMRHSFDELKAMGKALQNAQKLFHGTLIFSSLTAAEMMECGVKSNHLGGIVEYLKNVDGAYVSAFLYEKGKEEIKVSFRSEDCIDVAAICVGLGGGGHKKAAGCTLKCTLAQAQERILSILQQHLESED